MVIRLAFNHDISKFVANCEDDRQVIQALGGRRAGSDRPLITTSVSGARHRAGAAVGDGGWCGGYLKRIPRAASEEAANAVTATGVNIVGDAFASSTRHRQAGAG